MPDLNFLHHFKFIRGLSVPRCLAARGATSAHRNACFSAKVLLCGGLAFVYELGASSAFRKLQHFSKKRNKHEQSQDTEFLKRVFVQDVGEVTRSIPHNEEPVKLVVPVVSSSLVVQQTPGGVGVSPQHLRVPP